MPTPSLSLGSLGISSSWSSGSTLERSFSSSSLRTSPSKQDKASPGRVPQKSFGRQPARVAAAPVSPRASLPLMSTADDSSSLPDSVEDAQDFRQELARHLPTIHDEVDEATGLRIELDDLRKELRELRDASSKNDEVWQRENARLKEQIAAANARESALQEQLRVRDDQLALYRQELLDLQEYQLKVEEERAALVPPPIEDAGSSGLGRERELLKLVIQLVGASSVRKVLRENPNASSAQLHDALVQLRCSQCRRSSPSRASSPTKGTTSSNTDSLHKMLFGSSSRPTSPTATRFNSMGPRPPHH